jgi:hypothetical protein
MNEAKEVIEERLKELRAFMRKISEEKCIFIWENIIEEYPLEKELYLIWLTLEFLNNELMRIDKYTFERMDLIDERIKKLEGRER